MKSEQHVQEKFGDLLKAQEEAAEAKALEAGIAGSRDLNDAHKDIREPQYWPKDRDDEGYPIGRVQIPKKLWTRNWKIIRDHPKSGPFMHPIRLEDFPGYKEKVDRPMDLDTANRIARSGVAYACTDELIDLMYLIFDNAMSYYEPDHDIYKAAVELKDLTRKLMNDSQKAFAAEVNAYMALKRQDKARRELNEQQQKMQKVIKKLLGDERSDLFRKLPDDLDRAIPGYTEVIQRPMDLKTIENQLWTYEGENAKDDFFADLCLVFDNAMQYNKEGSEIYKNAQELQVVAEQYYLQLVEEEDANAVKAIVEKRLAALSKPAGEMTQKGRRKPQSMVQMSQDAVKEIFSQGGATGVSSGISKALVSSSLL